MADGLLPKAGAKVLLFFDIRKYFGKKIQFCVLFYPFRTKNGVPRFTTRHTFEKIYSKYSRRVSFLWYVYM